MRSHKKSGREVGGQKSPRAAAPPFSKSDVVATLSGIGDLVDVRYRVKKGMARMSPILLIDEKTGKFSTVGTVPRVGMLMTRNPKVDRVGFLLFTNPENVVKAGSLVTLIVGSYTKRHIRVD